MPAPAAKNPLRTARWIVLALALLALVGSVAGPTVDARPSHMVEHYYYDGPDYANQVGYKWVTCGGVISWGQVTQWVFTIDGDDC